LTSYQEYNKLWPIRGDIFSRSMLRATSIGLPADNDPLKASGTYLIAPEETIAFGISPFGGYSAGEATAEAGGNIDRSSMQTKINAATVQQIFQPGDTTAAASTIRSFQQLLDGAPAHSETLVYKIEKRNADTGNLVQTFYMPNVDGGFRYIDSQVLYGVRYQYDIMPIRAVVGNQYRYTNLMVLPEEVTELGTGHALGNALGFYQDTEIGSVYGPLIEATTSTYLAEAGADTGIATGHIGKFIFKDNNARRNFMCIDDPFLGDYDSTEWPGRIVLDLGLDDGVNNNVDGGATAKRINLTLTEVQQCAGTQTIGGAMTFGGGSFSTAATWSYMSPCSNGNFVNWLNFQALHGWPDVSDLMGSGITAQDLLTATGIDVLALGTVINIYKNLHGCPTWEYTG
jgi:hypothetical protein